MSAAAKTTPPAREHLRMLKAAYWETKRHLDRLEVEINDVREQIQRSCSHDWELDDSARGGRSYYECTKCGAYR